MNEVEEAEVEGNGVQGIEIERERRRILRLKMRGGRERNVREMKKMRVIYREGGGFGGFSKFVRESLEDPIA